MTSTSLPVVQGADVLSSRHVPTWLALTFASGAVNGGAFLLSQRFVSHITGTVARLGVSAQEQALMLDLLFALAFFVLGAMTSVFLVRFQLARHRQARYDLALGGVALVLLGVALAGHHGAFGPADEVVTTTDLVLMCVLAFAMGLLNATVAASTSAAIRPTHLTGTATDFGVNVATALVSSGAERRLALLWAALRLGKMSCFALGSMVMVPLVSSWAHAAFVLPAGLVVFAALTSFTPRPLFSLTRRIGVSS